MLSKHSPEIAAEYANTSVALDCADPEILKRWNQSVHSPTAGQECKNIGWQGNGKQVEAPTNSERQEMRWTEERSDGTQVEHVRRQTTSVDSENRTAVVQQAEVNFAAVQLQMQRELQSFTLNQFQLANKNFDEIAKVCGRHHDEIEKLKVAQHTQNEKMRLAEKNVTEMKLQRSHDKLRQAEREKDLEEFKSTVKKARCTYESKIEDMRMEHEKEMSDAKEHCRSLNVELGMCKLALRDQVRREKKFDQDHAENCRNYDNAINSLIQRVADIEDGTSMKPTSSKPTSSKPTLSKPTLSKPTSSKSTSSKGTSSKDGIPNTQTTVEQVAESMVADTVREHHLKVNGNPSRECRQPETSRKRQLRMEDVIGHACDDQVENPSQEALQRSEASLQSALDKNLFIDQFKMDYQANTKFMVYKAFDYDPVDYFTSGEFAKDEAKGLIFAHPLCCIVVAPKKYGKDPCVKMKMGKNAKMQMMMMTSSSSGRCSTLQEAFAMRRDACIRHADGIQTARLAKSNFRMNEREKEVRGVAPSSTSNPEEGCSSQAFKRTSNDGRGGGAQQSKRPRFAFNDPIHSRDKNFIEAAYERAELSTEPESEMERYDDERDKDYQP